MSSSNQRRIVLFVALLLLGSTAQAQLSDLPDLQTVTEVLGATSAEATANATSGTSASATDALETGTNVSHGDATKTSTANFGHLTNAPSLYGVGVPPLIVPDTSGAPFMHRSDLPEGFVFICVGAALAFCGLCIVLWRGMVAWALHRSVKRTATDRYISEKKSMYGGPTNYSSAYHSDNVSLEHLTAKDTSYKGAASQQRHSKSHSKPPQRASRQPSSSLFFSPTAGQGQNMGTRNSTYLPAGYYASSGSTLAAGSSMTNLGGPSAAGYGRVESYMDSPPRTAGTRPHSGYERRDRSQSRDGYSTLNAPTQRDHRRKSSNLRASSHEPSRAPSAVLDDLFQHSTGMR